MEVERYRVFFQRKKVEIEYLQSKMRSLNSKKDELDRRMNNLEQARKVVSRVGVLAQQEVKEVIEELVTQALQTVFGKDYSFEVDNQIQRNKPETNFYVVVDGRRHLLRGELGGGVVDLIAFCLRVVVWAISSPRTSSVIILDEPLKFLDGERLEQVGVMIKKLSEMLGLQFIIISHEDQLIDIADRAYLVEKEKGVSVVKRIV